MGSRHESIGIKQVIRMEWMQKAVNLLLAGLDSKSIRHELHDFLCARKGSGTDGERGDTSRTQVVNMLMKIWVTPDKDLVEFRGALLLFLRENQSQAVAVHWAMISSVYPFWHHTARQVGRLLNLQQRITQGQVFDRLKEQFGDRETVARYARYAIRSFIAWGVLKDSDVKGCYEGVAPFCIEDETLAVVLLESVLRAIPEGKGDLTLLVNNPAFFPFQLPMMTGDLISSRCARIDLVRYGLDDVLLKLR